MTEVSVSTVEQRLKVRAYYKKQGWAFECYRCGEKIDRSFAVYYGHPVHYGCDASARVKYEQGIRGMR